MLGSYIATQTELMQGTEVIDAVVERLRLAERPEFLQGFRGEPATLREWLATQLRKNIDIEQGRAGSQLIFVNAWARSPVIAADVANAIADVYTEQHFRTMTGPANDRAKRYTQDLADLKAKVARAQDALTHLRQSTGNIDFDARTDTESGLLVNLEHRLLEAQDAQRAAEARVAAGPVLTGSTRASDLVRSLRGEGAALGAKLSTLQTTLGPNHPQLVELRSQIAANSQALDAALRADLGVAQTDLVAARREVVELQATLRQQRGKILQNGVVRDEASKLQLELESAQSVYKRAIEGYNGIMFASSGEDSNMKFISRARPPTDPEKRKTATIFLGGVVGGVLIALAACFGYEMTRRRIRCRDDIERGFGFPVLAEFPALAPVTARSMSSA
jgi:uncharacterized protein involved in exopolysaccharide biosynthesis